MLKNISRHIRPIYDVNFHLCRGNPIAHSE
jgi:hypothetical protein